MNKKLQIYTVIAIVVLGITAFSLWRLNSELPSEPNNNDTVYDPPTEEELKETAKHKDEIAENMNQDSGQQTQSNGDKKQVDPVFSYWGQSSAGSDFEANGYVSEVIEEDGICTLQLTNNNTTVESSKAALPDAQSTSCGLLRISRSKLTSGKWKATLIYESPNSYGTSENITVEIE